MIKILSTNRLNGYFEVAIEIRIDIPQVLTGLPNKKEIAESYKAQYGIDRVDGNYIYFTKLCTFQDGTPISTIQGTFDTIATTYSQGMQAFALQPFDELIGKTYDGTNWVYINQPNE